MFRGNAEVRIDDKGRLKLPSRFSSIIPDTYGKRFFVTTLKGDCVWVFPLEAWIAIERKLAAAPSTNPSIVRFHRDANRNGMELEMDAAGRILIPPKLRATTGIDGDVLILGCNDRLEVWNLQAFEEARRKDPFTDADLEVLSRFNI